MTQRTQEVRSVDPGSFAKLSFVMYAIVGLLAGGIFSLFAALGAMGEPNPDDPAFINVIFGVGAIVILPIVYGVMAAISAAIGAAIYNVVAGFVGGFKVQLRADDVPQ